MLFSFFVTCNKIGAFTLGGGYAMIPIMEREFVDRHKGMDKQEFGTGHTGHLCHRYGKSHRI